MAADSNINMASMAPHIFRFSLMKFLAPLRDADSESDMTSMEVIVKRFEFFISEER